MTEKKVSEKESKKKTAKCWWCGKAGGAVTILACTDKPGGNPVRSRSVKVHMNCYEEIRSGNVQGQAGKANGN